MHMALPAWGGHFLLVINTTSLCAQRSSKKCTSIACWTARFFRWKKLSKKALYLFGLVVLALVTAFGSLFKVREFDVLWPLRLPGFLADGYSTDEPSARVVGNWAISKSEANIENFSEWVAGTMVPRVRMLESFCETSSTPQEPYCTPRNERKNSTWAMIANCEIPYIKKPSQNANFLLTPSKPQDKLTILYYNKKLDI